MLQKLLINAEEVAQNSWCTLSLSLTLPFSLTLPLSHPPPLSIGKNRIKIRCSLKDLSIQEKKQVHCIPSM